MTAAAAAATATAEEKAEAKLPRRAGARAARKLAGVAGALPDKAATPQPEGAIDSGNRSVQPPRARRAQGRLQRWPLRCCLRGRRKRRVRAKA